MPAGRDIRCHTNTSPAYPAISLTFFHWSRSPRGQIDIYHCWEIRQTPGYHGIDGRMSQQGSRSQISEAGRVHIISSMQIVAETKKRFNSVVYAQAASSSLQVKFGNSSLIGQSTMVVGQRRKGSGPPKSPTIPTLTGWLPRCAKIQEQQKERPWPNLGAARYCACPFAEKKKKNHKNGIAIRSS